MHLELLIGKIRRTELCFKWPFLQGCVTSFTDECVCLNQTSISQDFENPYFCFASPDMENSRLKEEPVIIL